MTPKRGHADPDNAPIGAAGGTPLAELPSQRRRGGGRRSALHLRSQAGVPPSCRNTRDAVLSSTLPFCCCTGTAGGLLCSGTHRSLRYLHFSEELVSSIEQAEANPRSAPLRSVCRLGSARCRGKRRAIAALLLHQSLHPAFPSEPTLPEQHAARGRRYGWRRGSPPRRGGGRGTCGGANILGEPLAGRRRFSRRRHQLSRGFSKLRVMQEGGRRSGDGEGTGPAPSARNPCPRQCSG